MRIVGTLCRYGGDQLSLAPAALLADRDFILAAIAVNDDALQFAAADLQADREVVLVAVPAPTDRPLR